MNTFEPILDYLPNILRGALLTVEIAVVSYILAVLIGFVFALMRQSDSRVPTLISAAYTTIVRGIPDLIWILLSYYSVQIALNSLTESLGWQDVQISPFAAGIFSLSFIFGAFCAETIRGALQAVGHGQIEAARACGLSSFHIALRIKFPLMMRNALPGLRNNWLVLTKSTALISLIGLDDMTHVAQSAGSSTGLPFMFNLLSACLYLILTAVSLLAYRYIAHRFDRGHVRESVDVG